MTCNITLTASDGRTFTIRGVPAELVDYAKSQVREEATQAGSPKPWFVHKKEVK